MIKNQIENHLLNEEKVCNGCYFFFNCQVEGIDIHQFCSTHPEALGYCELWSGPVKNYVPCHGWTPR